MSRSFNFILLGILAVVDSWMISHPNLMGKAGVFIYRYSMIKNFPNALLTVSVTLCSCYCIAWFLRNRKDKKWAFWSLTGFLGVSILLLIIMLFKFNTGVYARTGTPFRFGMILLPFLMVYIFAKELLFERRELPKSF